MDSFWLNPPPPNDPSASTRLWDAVIAYLQPAAPRRIRALQRARIILATSGGVDLVCAIWGLVPAWAAAVERRSVAQRHTLLDAGLTPDSSMLGDLWAMQQPSRRCLVPASGWTAPSSYHQLAFAPELGAITLAGLQTTVHIEGRAPVYTFGVFYRSVEFSPYDGSRVPVVVRAEDRLRWLTGKPGEARRLLQPPGMKVRVRRLRDDGAAARAVFGPDYDDREIAPGLTPAAYAAAVTGTSRGEPGRR